MPVIKRVGNYIIELRESTSCYTPKWLTPIGVFVFLGAWLMLIYKRAQMYGYTGWMLDNPSEIVFCGIGASILTIIVAFVIVVSPLGRAYKPAYEVLVSGDYLSIITIPKTDNPEADQIAICKAAKEIEAELIEIQTREARLEEMARKCK